MLYHTGWVIPFWMKEVTKLEIARLGDFFFLNQVEEEHFVRKRPLSTEKLNARGNAEWLGDTALARAQ